MQTRKPKIGVALSGGAARAAAHVAVMDVLAENGIIPEIIVGCSSGAIVAVAFGAGTRDYALQLFNSMSLKRAWSLWSWRGSRGGMFHFHKAKAEFFGLTKGLNFEDLPIKVGVTAADIETGELRVITTGNITQGLKATMAIPGLFEPMIIDNRILLEGGLVNIVPTASVKQLGADIVIGVDVAKAKFFFQKKMPIFRLIRRIRRLLGIEFVQHQVIKPLTTHMEKQFGIKKRRMPNSFRIFFWAVDRSFDVEKEWDEEKRSCDILIQPAVADTAKLEVNKTDYIYEQGRAATLNALPQLKRLIQEFETKQEKVMAKNG